MGVQNDWINKRYFTYNGNSSLFMGLTNASKKNRQLHNNKNTKSQTNIFRKQNVTSRRKRRLLR